MPFRVHRDARFNLDGWIAGASGNLLLECSTIKIGDDPASTMEHQLITTFVAIAVLGIGAQWLAWRLHIPSILILLCFGFLVGPVTGFLDPDALFGELLLQFAGVSASAGAFRTGGSLSAFESVGFGGGR